MSNMINLNLDSNVIPINFGAFTLNFKSTDAKEVEMTAKAKELMEKAAELEELEKKVDSGKATDGELRKSVKDVLDDVFITMFDKDAPQKIYEACGEHTWTYLNAFLQIAEHLQEIKEQRANDETFKKYLAE